MGEETSAGAIVRHLHELKIALELAGYIATVNRPPGMPPYLTAVNPEVSRLSETIRCGRRHPDDEQLWVRGRRTEAATTAIELYDRLKAEHDPRRVLLPKAERERSA
ncbi:hypothetical protein GCM10023196_055740 [Actinoallomurus vinaceus]|uniref:Uncharacterized protein n=2 Tax=Actinoallomurus vinaceus TaxID=1080074 RepID=A0ABP8UG00_9ACTN